MKEEWRTEAGNTVPTGSLFVDGERVGGVLGTVFGWIGYTSTNTDGMYRTLDEAMRWVEENYRRVL